MGHGLGLASSQKLGDVGPLRVESRPISGRGRDGREVAAINWPYHGRLLLDLTFLSFLLTRGWPIADVKLDPPVFCPVFFGIIGGDGLS